MEVGADYVILVSRFQNGRWTQPEIASFSGKYSDAEPFMAPNGSKLFFASKRPLEGETPRKDYDIWVVERLANGSWGAPKHLGDSINTDAQELYPAVTKDGTLYFSRFAPGGIWHSRYIGGHFERAEKLVAPVNADLKEAGVYVAPDEHYIIFEAKDPKGLGGTDLYISYKQGEAWTQPRNLGAPINSSAEETCAMISPDGRYLFFTSNRKLPNTNVSIGEGLTYPEIIGRLNGLGRGRWHIYYVSTASLGIK
jgi:Tol biopolymer transport system component